MSTSTKAGGWASATTDGNFVVDPKAWPALAPGEKAGDMTNIVRYIHGLGLKAGIYTDAGIDGCSMYPDLGPVYKHVGSEGHYEQDFLQFAQWGFDYVKVDWCGGDKEKLDPAVQYAEIARAIAKAEAATGRRLYFSLCEWGKNNPWTWAANVGGAPADIWRTSGDIVAPIVPHHEVQRTAGQLSRRVVQLRPGRSSRGGAYRLLQRSGHDGGGHAGPDRRAEPGAHEPVGHLRRAAAGGRGPDHHERSNPRHAHQRRCAGGRPGFAGAARGQGSILWRWAGGVVEGAGDTRRARGAAAEPHRRSKTDFLSSSHDIGLLDSSPATVRDPWAHKDLEPFTGSDSATYPQATRYCSSSAARSPSLPSTNPPAECNSKQTTPSNSST